jgi:hypothetical protein
MKPAVCQQLLDTAKLELVKYLQIFVVNPRRMGMLALFGGTQPCLVDEAWHQLTENATEFCCSNLGEFVAHLKVECPRETLAWVITYEKAHGHLPDVWFRNQEGSLDTESYNTYLQDYLSRTRREDDLPEIENSWRCSPGTAEEELLLLPEIKNSWKCSPGIPQEACESLSAA